MKSRYLLLAFSTLCFFLVVACTKPADFTGFWKVNRKDAFGVQIKKQSGNPFSVSFCGPGGCFAPGEWRPNTTIIGDPQYRVLNATTIEIGDGKGWTRYTRYAADANPVLDYSTMPAPNKETISGNVSVESPTRKQSGTKIEEDIHRPACTSPRCRKIRTFLKLHYCGESPFANGPEDGCEIKTIEKPGTGTEVIADYRCEWNEKKYTAECKQRGGLPPAIHDILVGELRRAGLPAETNRQTYFSLWKSTQGHWSLAVAYYSHQVQSELELCEVIAVIDDSSHAVLLRQLPFQRTDIDVPEVTQWAPVDIANVEGNGHDDIVLEGDAYEDHWLEVVSLHDGTARTIFSGLGYYL